MIRTICQGEIELEFNGPVRVLDLVERINKEIGIVNPNVTQNWQGLLAEPVIIVTGDLDQGYTIILNPNHDAKTPINDINSKNLRVTQIRYEQLQRVHDELITS